MKSAKIAAAAALIVTGVAFHANAAGPYPLDNGGTVAAVHCGTVTCHFFIPQTSHNQGGWFGFENSANSGLVSMTSGALHQPIIFSLSGNTVPCNPFVCGGVTAVPEVADIEFPSPFSESP